MGVIWCISVVLMIYHMGKAPNGYEDADGFHYDNKNKK
jgi:hypothetical protein